MLTRHEALEIVRSRLASASDSNDWVVLEEATQEYDFGWVIYYNTAAYAESRNSYDSLVGNAPFLIERSAGDIFQLGTACPVEHYVETYRKFGDPHARLSRLFRLSGWNTGAVAISAIKVVRAHTGATLVDAKRQVEQVIDGGFADFEAQSVDHASAAVRELRACGFIAEQLLEGRVT